MCYTFAIIYNSMFEHSLTQWYNLVCLERCVADILVFASCYFWFVINNKQRITNNELQMTSNKL